MLVVLALLRLGLLRKRVLLFVNGIDAGFRLRLFLESFGVRAAVLNSELPVNSRHHILQVRLHQEFESTRLPHVWIQSCEELCAS